LDDVAEAALLGSERRTIGPQTMIERRRITCLHAGIRFAVHRLADRLDDLVEPVDVHPRHGSERHGQARLMGQQLIGRDVLPPPALELRDQFGTLVVREN